MEHKPAKKINVLVADDHKIFRKGMGVTLRNMDMVENVFFAGDGAAVLEIADAHPIDLVFMDVKMPGMTGAETSRRLKVKFPEMCIIALSMYDQEEVVTAMLASGASGYLLKNTDEYEIREAMQRVISGGKHISTEVSGAVFKKLTGNPREKNRDTEPQLNAREKEILVLICRQFSNKMIADELRLSPRTVEGYRRKVMDKAGAKNTAGLVAFAISRKIWNGK